MTGFYSEVTHVIPVLAPIDIIATDVATDLVDAGEATRLQFHVNFGVITGDVCVVTVNDADDNVPTNVNAIAFNYRLSSAVGTDVMGAITAATTSGVSIAATDDGKMLVIDIDPAQLTAGYPYVKVVLTTGGSMSACLVSANCIATPRNAQSVTPSMVD